MHAVANFFAGIVSGGNGIGALLYGIVQKAFKFDFGIAQDIRVWRATCAVFFEEIGKYIVFILRGKIDDVDIDTDDIGNGNGIKGVLFNAAIFVVVVIFPVLHEHAADLMALLFEQGRGNGGIDAAGKADDDVCWCAGSIHEGNVGFKYIF